METPRIEIAPHAVARNRERTSHIFPLAAQNSPFSSGYLDSRFTGHDSCSSSGSARLRVHCLPLSQRRAASPCEAMPTRRLAVVGLISLTGAELFSGAYASHEGFITEGLCGEESAACAAPGEISDISSATDGLPPAKTERKWARGKREKRRRRVGFSHEDVAGDESLRPFVQAFRDSLSGNEKGVSVSAEQDVSELLTDKKTSMPAAEEGDEVMPRQL